MFSTLKGLIFPDEYVIKFFFKNGLQNRTGSVLELGCGSGNNLLLFKAFGWNVTGIDMDHQAIDYARDNLKKFGSPNSEERLIQGKIESVSLLLNEEDKFDVITLPNIICYISRKSAQALLDFLAKILKPGGLVFLRTRTISDYRYGRGREIERNGFELETEETGEMGMLNVFYHEWELVELLKDHLKLETDGLTILHVDFENLQGGKIIKNSDIVMWGRCGR